MIFLRRHRWCSQQVRSANDWGVFGVSVRRRSQGMLEEALRGDCVCFIMILRLEDFLLVRRWYAAFTEWNLGLGFTDS